jgi:hypothetical protein
MQRMYAKKDKTNEFSKSVSKAAKALRCLTTGMAHVFQEIGEKTAMRELGNTRLQNHSGGAHRFYKNFLLSMLTCLQKISPTVQTKRRELSTKDVTFIHDNAPP